MGNHDFDIGLDGFLRNLPHAEFPFLCSNYDFTNTILDGKTMPYKIFVKDGLKIGVFGIGVQLKGLVLEKLYGETKYLDPIEIANDMSLMLKEEKKCHYVICLSHLGYNYETKVCDTRLAAQTKNVDLILGGHSHTFLDQPVPFKNLEGKDVLVAQTGFAGLRLGRIDVLFDRIRSKVNAKGSAQINVS
jgi:5'-nucleotidase